MIGCPKCENTCRHQVTTNINTILDGNHMVMACDICLALKTCDGRWIKDATGLCTVRDWAQAVVEGNILAAYSTNVGFVPPSTLMKPGKVCPWGEMTFTHKGRRFSVEMVVTKAEPFTEK